MSSSPAAEKVITSPTSLRSGEPRRPRRCVKGRASVGAAVVQNREYGLPDDQSVERERPLLDVAQIETNRLLPVQVRAAADLPQSGDARLHEQSSSRLAVVRPIGD